MTQHSLLGASSAYRWLACPGSFALSQTAPHRPSSIYAATGSLAHNYIEVAVAGGIAEIGSEAVGRPWSQDGHTGTVDQELIDGVNVMLAYIDPTFKDWREVEFRISLDAYFPGGSPVPVFGTLDAGLLEGRTLEIVDYKNGAGVAVSPVENPQLMFYAAGALRHPGLPAQARIDTVKLTIVQPNAPGLAPIRSWEITVLDLLMWVDEVLVPGVLACAEPDAPFNPGSWCRFCPVSHACPRLQQDAVAMAKHEFDDAPPYEPHDPLDLAAALDRAERAELWITRLREYATDQLKSQVRIPGWGLVPTRPTRKWVGPEDDIAAQLGTLGLQTVSIFETRLRSPAQLERQLLRTAQGRLIWDQAAVMVEAKSTGVKLGRTGVSAGEEFDE